jgi:hypothetical protein
MPLIADVMQVCRNGHVITDMLRAHPESGLSHCDRCGAVTLERCLTCGHELRGAVALSGPRPLGTGPAPLYCAICGAAFPWTNRPGPAPRLEPLGLLERLLGRLPLVIRQLRTRHADRPAFRVHDIHDLEDLIRALLPLHFDEVRPEARTPRYATGNRTDFLLAPEQIALTVKLAGPDQRGPQLARQWHEDVAYYHRLRSCRTLVFFIYDAEGLLRHFAPLALADPPPADELEVHWLVAAP